MLCRFGFHASARALEREEVKGTDRMEDQVEDQGHDSVCEVCGAVIPCEEEGCMEPAMHPYVCKDCVRIPLNPFAFSKGEE